MEEVVDDLMSALKLRLGKIKRTEKHCLSGFNDDNTWYTNLVFVAFILEINGENRLMKEKRSRNTTRKNLAASTPSLSNLMV